MKAYSDDPAIQQIGGPHLMSILNCDECGDIIDTDERPETYRERFDKWLCDICYRELRFWTQDTETYDPPGEQARRV